MAFIRAFLIILVIAIGLTAVAAIDVENSSDERIVRIWFSHIEEENQAMRTIAEEFTAQTGIAVEVISRRSIFDAPRDFANNAELPERPDLVFMQAPDIGNLVRSGFLSPLDLDNDTRSRFVNAAFDAFTYKGELYGVGYSVDTSGLVYNSDLITMDELPRTWDEFFQTAEKLTIRDGDGRIVQRGTLLNPKDMWFNYPIIKEFGGYYFGQLRCGTYNSYDVGLDNEGMLEYVNKMKELQAKGLTLTNPNATESHISAEFAKGRVAMILYGLWDASIYQSMGVNYAIAKLPKGRDGRISQPLATVQGFVINRFTRDFDASLAFLLFILQDEHQQFLIEAGNRGLAKTGERNPANISVIQSPYIKDDPVLSSLSEIGSFCSPFPNIPEGPIWYNYTTTAFRTIFFGDRHGREVDAQEMLKELADAIRNDVALINQIPDQAAFSWSDYVILTALIAVIAFLALRAARGRKASATEYFGGRLSKRESLLGWILLFPLFFLVITFYVFPVFHNIYLSLTNYSGIRLRDYVFVGTANYREIFTKGIDGLVSMFVWTVSFAISVVSLSFLAGTALATILEKVGIRVSKIYRVVFILPWVVPSVITLLTWRGFLDENGLVNQLLAFVGVPSVSWLSNPLAARVSTILVMTWFSFPYFMVVASGILKSIPKDYYDVAKIAGASRAWLFFRITLPMVYRAIFPMLIMAFIMQFNQFGVYLLTEGGPPADKLGAPGATDLLITYVFNTAFNTKRYSMAAAYSVIIFCFVGLLAFVSMASSTRKENELR